MLHSLLAFAPRSLRRIGRHARRQFRLDVLVATGALVHHRLERFMVGGIMMSPERLAGRLRAPQVAWMTLKGF